MTQVVHNTEGLDARLVLVLDQYLDALQAGKAPARAELIAKYPDLAEELEACLVSLDFIRSAGSDASNGTSARRDCLAHSSAMPNGKSVHLGDYRIVREVGRGGMGIVYEAEQISLGCRVALKVLPFAAALDPLQVQRFQNEAKAAALLQHPHIVPVLGVGSEGDVNYYVMEYIEGHALSTVIQSRRAARNTTRELVKPSAETPNQRMASTVPLGEYHGPGPGPNPLDFNDSFFRQTARFGLQAAQALEHAHQAGIIHRDIKPGNLLVNPTGHLWVADFGLARFQNDGRNLTLSGDLIGTLRYMSPEQALGKKGIVDQRADIYSLGITLYELLTLKPAFPGNDRQELLRQIAEDDPSPPRRLNKAIPDALETIVLKAIAKEPGARYATAQDLADDLVRFLAGQPIAAKRPSLAKVAARLARRHKRLVAGIAALLVLAFLGLGATSLIIMRERDDADRRALQALRTVDDLYTQVAQRWWSQQPYMEQVQREFLLKALHAYEEFSKEKGDAPRWRLETAKAARRVGDINHKLGERARAAEAYALAISGLKRLADEFPLERLQRDELANALNNHGNLLREQGRWNDAAESYRQAQKLFAALLEEDAKSPDYREGLASAVGNMGIVLHSQGNPVEAEKAYEKAGIVFESLTKDHPYVPAYGHGWAGCRNNLASLLRDTGRPRAALVAYEQAISAWAKLGADWPGMPLFRQAQAASYSGLGIVHATLGRSGAAETAHRQAFALRQRLTQEYPSVPAYRQALASSNHSLGRLLASIGNIKDARVAFDQAVAVRKSLSEEMPDLEVYRQELADSYDGLGGLLTAVGQMKQAEQAQRAAQALRQRLAKELPNSPDAQGDLARSCRALGGILRGLNQVEDATQNISEAISIGEKLTTAFPNVPAFCLELATAQGELASIDQFKGQLPEAEQLLRASLSLREKLAAKYPETPYYRLELATGYCQQGELSRSMGKPVDAEAAYRRAIALVQPLTNGAPSIPEYRRLLALAQAQMGELLRDEGRLVEAEKPLQTAQALFNHLSLEMPGIMEFRRESARCRHSLGLLWGRLDRHDFAEQAFGQELGLREKLADDFPDNIDVSLDFAYSLANCPDASLRQPLRAWELAVKAVQQSPVDARAWMFLSVMQYRTLFPR